MSVKQRREHGQRFQHIYDLEMLKELPEHSMKLNVVHVEKYIQRLEKGACRLDTLLQGGTMRYFSRKRAFTPNAICAMSRIKERLWNTFTSWKRRMDGRKLIDSVPFQRRSKSSLLMTYWK